MSIANASSPAASPKYVQVVPKSNISTAAQSCAAGEGFGPFNELISSLVVHIPDISVTTIKDVKYLNITKMVCGKFVVGDIEISPTGTAEKPAVGLNLTGIDVGCNFTLKTKVGILKFDGNVDAAITDIGAIVAADLQFAPVPGYPQYNVPNSSKASSCALDMKIDLKFSGGILPELLNIVKGLLEKMIRNAVETKGCDALNGLLTNTTTQLLQFVDQGVAQFVAPPTPHQPPILPSSEQFVALTSSKALNAIMGWLAQPASINRLVDCVTNHSGVAAIKDMNLTIDLGDDNLTTTNVTLQNISISGLDTFTALSLFQPGYAPGADAGTVFTSLIALDKLGIDVGVDLGLGPGSAASSHAGSIVEHLNLSFGFERFTLNATAVVAILSQRLRDVRLLRLLENPVGCIVFPLYTINVTFLDLDIGNLDGPSESGFICSGIDCVINHVVDVLRLAYADVVMQVTRGGLSTTAALALNNLLAEIIHNMSAPINSSATFLDAPLSSLVKSLSSTSPALTSEPSAHDQGLQCVEPPQLPSSTTGTRFVNLSNWTFLADVSGGLQYVADHFYNKFVDFLTCQTGAINLTTNLSFGVGPNFNKMGIDTVEIGVVGPVELSNLDIIKNLSLLRPDPRNPYELHHRISLLPHRAGAADNADTPMDGFGISLPLSVLWKGQGSDSQSTTEVSFDEHIRLTLKIGGVDVRLTTYTEVNETALAAQTLGSIFGNSSANDVACLLTMFDGGSLNITRINASIPMLELALTCDECDGKLDLEIISERMQLPGVRDSLERGIQSALDWLGEPNSSVLGLVNDVLAKSVANAPSNCSVYTPGPPVTPPTINPPITAGVIAVTSGFIVCAIVVLIISLLCCTKRRAERRQRRPKRRGVSFDIVHVRDDGQTERRPFFDNEETDQMVNPVGGDSDDDTTGEQATGSTMRKSQSADRALSASGGRQRAWTGSLADNLVMDITDRILDGEERRVRARTLSGSGVTTRDVLDDTHALEEHLLGSDPNSTSNEPNNADDGGDRDRHPHIEKSAVWSMCVHGASNAVANFGIPLLLVVNIGVFISAHTTVGATVDAVISVAPIPSNSTTPPTKIILSDVYDFSLGDSIRNMWDAEVYPLALLIAVFSGAWPYLKIVLMLLSWFAPEKCLNSTRRGHLLQALDALGKWSLIDNYVLVLMMVAFRMHIAIPDVDTVVVPAGWLSVDVVVVPGWGIYGFLVAAILSLVCTHLIVFYHRQAVQEEKEVAAAAAMLKKIQKLQSTKGGRQRVAVAERFADHEYHFAVPSKQTVLHVKLTIFSQMLIFGAIIGTMFLTALGVILQTFQFEFEGLVGLLLAPQNASATNYSLLSVGEAVGTSTLTGQATAGNTYLQVVFFAFACFIPAMHLVLLLVLWVIPLNLKEHRHFFVASEVLGAWSSMDVFTVSIVVRICLCDLALSLQRRVDSVLMCTV